MRTSFRLRVLLAVGVLAVGTMVAAGSVSAIGGSGTAWQQKKVRSYLPDLYRVGAKATKLDANTKARGRLAVNNYPDRATVWFTKLNKGYFSEWGMGSGAPIFEMHAL